ncbi:hypothetical protein QCA50_016039 [Cerrena zonata]|uniref:Uncharacterized protein n=1 Tax=Cerrena zonata TaxID=2478898 RepID=A0AAW0FTM9_9APHY
MATPTQVLSDFGLTPEHKIFLETYFDRYIDGATNAARRAVAVEAAGALAVKYRITTKHDVTANRKRVINWLYDRLARSNNVNIDRYGFLKKLVGRTLWAERNWSKIKPNVEAHMKKKNVHFLTAYNAVTREAFLGLPKREVIRWNADARRINDGNATEEYQAIYGDMVFAEFIYTILQSAQKWFGAHMVIMSSRPSEKLSSKHSTSIRETVPPNIFQRKFIDQWEDPYTMSGHEYTAWLARIAGGKPAQPDLITFDGHGEPLLPSLSQYTTAEQHRDVLQAFLTTHYKLASCNPIGAPPYILMPGDGVVWLDLMYLPSEEAADPYEVYLRKPGTLRGDQRFKFLSHLLKRQSRYLAGEPLLIFRWRSIKIGRKKAPKIVLAQYEEPWMIQYATDHGKIIIPGQDGNEGDNDQHPGPSTKVTIPHRATKSQAEDGEEDEEDQVEDMMIAGEDDDGDDLEPPLSTRSITREDDQDEIDEDFTSRLDAIDSDDSDEPSAPQPPSRATKRKTRKGKGKNVKERRIMSPDAESSPPHRSPLILPSEPPAGSVRNEDLSPPPSIGEPDDEEEDEMDAMMRRMEAEVAIERPVSPTPDPNSPPSWIRNDVHMKVPFLRSLSTNEDYHSIVDWYAAQQVHVELRPSSFPWASWSSDEPHLPADIHSSIMGCLTVLRPINVWKRSKSKYLDDLSKLELNLLIAELTINTPPHLWTSKFTDDNFYGIIVALKKIAESYHPAGEDVPPSGSVAVPPVSQPFSDSISAPLRAKQPLQRTVSHPQEANNAAAGPSPPTCYSCAGRR